MAVDSPTALTEPLQPKDEHLHEDHSDNWDDVWGEVKEQLKLAYPIIGMNVVQLFLVLSSAAFVGHLGALSLASAQLATSLANATGHYLLVRAIPYLTCPQRVRSWLESWGGFLTAGSD
jgi:hypothetical protein